MKEITLNEKAFTDLDLPKEMRKHIESGGKVYEVENPRQTYVSTLTGIACYVPNGYVWHKGEEKVITEPTHRCLNMSAAHLSPETIIALYDLYTDANRALTEDFDLYLYANYSSFDENGHIKEDFIIEFGHLHNDFWTETKCCWWWHGKTNTHPLESLRNCITFAIEQGCDQIRFLPASAKEPFADLPVYKEMEDVFWAVAKYNEEEELIPLKFYKSRAKADEVRQKLQQAAEDAAEELDCDPEDYRTVRYQFLDEVETEVSYV